MFLGSDRGLWGPQMCDSGSLGMFEIDLLRGVVIGVSKGHRNNILKVHNYLGFFVGVNDQKFLI